MLHETSRLVVFYTACVPMWASVDVLDTNVAHVTVKVTYRVLCCMKQVVWGSYTLHVCLCGAYGGAFGTNVARWVLCCMKQVVWWPYTLHMCLCGRMWVY